MRASCSSLALLAALSACAPAAPAAGIPPGNARQTAMIAGTELTLYTHRPATCTPRLLLLVFHGVSRNAGPYRDHARPIADATCAVIVAPEFDHARFPRDLYQYGGLTERPPGQRSIDLVPAIAAWARAQLAAPGLPLVLLAHSAGAQFLDRVAAFVPTGAAAIVLANPSTWVMPSTAVPAPFGLGGTPLATDAGLRAYLALPVTVLLGGADTGPHQLDMSAEAMRQGPNRLARGHAAYDAARQAAQAHGWTLGWTLAEVPGVGHDATRMFAAPQAIEAVRRAVP